MIDRRRETVRTRRRPLLAVACLGASLALAGCTDFRRALGMDRVGPDEFMVESRAPLTIPPEFDLRPPQPGALRPQEATPADRARKVIDTAGPGEPGKRATAALKVPAGGVVGSGIQPDTGQQVGEQSLAAKLLGANDSAPAGAAEKRDTQTLKGVY